MEKDKKKADRLEILGHVAKALQVDLSASLAKRIDDLEAGIKKLDDDLADAKGEIQAKNDHIRLLKGLVIEDGFEQYKEKSAAFDKINEITKKYVMHKIDAKKAMYDILAELATVPTLPKTKDKETVMERMAKETQEIIDEKLKDEK